MRNSHFSAFLGLIVAIGGAVILAGWLFGIEDFVRPADGLARVKPITALCYFIAGFQLILTAYQQSKRNFAVVIAGASLFQLVVMGSQLVAAFSDAPGIEWTINSPVVAPAFNTDFRAASVGTILILLGVATVGLLDIIGGGTLLRRIVDKMTLTIPTVALVGYIIGAPALYFDLPGISAKIAIYSAVLGFVAGCSLYFSSPPFVRRDKTIESEKEK